MPTPAQELTGWLDYVFSHPALLLQGTDALYDFPKRKGSKRRKKMFGALRVIPFPFTAIFEPDDGSKNIIFQHKLEKLEHLVGLNDEETVNVARNVRLKLRCLAGQNVKL